MATITRTNDRDREALRRSALGTNQGPTAEQQAGAFPRSDMLTRLGEPQSPTDVSFPFLRHMRRDHMVAMGLHFISMPIVNAPWYFEADDPKVSAFADSVIRPIYGSLVLTLLRMLSFGYSPAVKNFEVISKPSWTYLPGIDEDPQLVWDQGGIDALIYSPVTELKPENCRPSFDSQGRFDGINYDNLYGGVGYFLVQGQKKPKIDLLHSVWAVHDKENEDGSPYGFPRIAHCAPIFHMYSYIWTLLGRAFENNADPGPVIRYPANELTNFTDERGEPLDNVDVALRLGRRRRSGSTIALPSDPYLDLSDKPTGLQKWAIEYPTASTNFSEIIEFIGFLESAKLRSLWLQEQGIIEGSGGQSNRNVASEFGDQRNDSLIVLMRQVIDVIENSFVKPMIAMNMPWYQGNIEMKLAGFGTAEEELVRQILQLAGQGENGYRNFGVDLRRILKSKDIPLLSPADYRKEQEKAAEAAQKAAAPAVEPTQGRRSLVKQTGFDRETKQPIMSYVQLGDSHLMGHPIEFSTDDDFSNSLPGTDAFSDATVVSAARGLRTTSKSFLSWAYFDFARHLDTTKLELSDDADGEEFASKVVTRIMSSWQPKVDRLGSYRDAVIKSIGRIYDRTAKGHLTRLGSNVKVKSSDSLAADWIEKRGLELMDNVLSTTRDQLKTVLADGVREGLELEEIAKEIRKHFADFPEARATMIARTETSAAYNYATASTGIAAGVKKAQLLDGNDDDNCRSRNGKIVNLSDAIKQKLNHPNCTFTIRLLPSAPEDLSVRHESLNGFRARYDEDTSTVLFSTSTTPEQQTEYLLALGSHFAEPISVD